MSVLELEISNIGGIDELNTSIDSENTLVAGVNASNKTSMLQAIMFAFGAEDAPIKSDADEAKVTLTHDGRTVERVATRAGGGVRTSGESWLQQPDDTILVDRFANLLETNSLRTAVAQNGDIETLLKEPMNLDALEDERSAKLNQKRELQQRLDQLSDVDEQLADRKTELAEKRERASELEAELEDLYDERTSTGDVDEELQTLREERADLISNRDEYAEQVDELETAIERFDEQLSDLEADVETAKSEQKEHDVERLKKERMKIQTELEEVTDRIDVLQSVLTANREMINSEFTEILGFEAGLMEEQVTCWACGQSAERPAYDDTIEELTELIERDKKRKRERKPEIEALNGKIETAQNASKRVRELEAKLQDFEQERKNRRESLEQKREQLADVRDRIEAVDEQIAERESEQSSTQSDISADIEEMRIDLNTVRRDIDRLEDVHDNLRQQREERADLRETVDELSDDIQRLTERIENQEQHLREEFNQAMDDLLDALQFNRIERVWLDGDFNLVIAREVDATVREDSLQHLAESEREMIGLVLGLAGFITYDVADVAPILVLDSLGAFDTARTRRLIEYFADKTDILLAAVHPQIAAELEFDTFSFNTKLPS